MPVVAMKVQSKQAHEKTDSLFIYTFKSPEQGEVQVVANLTNVYEVDDVVAVALVGTRLPEGEIKARRVFDIPSSGMALGPVEAALDSDLTAQFDADQPLRRFAITLTVEVEGHYAADAEKAARKILKSGKGSLVSADLIDA